MSHRFINISLCALILLAGSSGFSQTESYHIDNGMNFIL